VLRVQCARFNFLAFYFIQLYYFQAFITCLYIDVQQNAIIYQDAKILFFEFNKSLKTTNHYYDILIIVIEKQNVILFITHNK